MSLIFKQCYAWLAAIVGAVCMSLVGVNYLQGSVNSLMQIGGMSLFVVFFHRQTKNTFFITWLFTSTWLIISVWWLYIALHDIGGMPWFIAVIAIGLLCGGLAIYYAASLNIYFFLKDSLKPVYRPVLFAACWTVAEIARAQWFTGFPWSAIGYAHVNGILSYAAPWIGVYGIGFVSAMIACWAANILAKEKQTLKAKIQISGLIIILSFPAVRSANSQGNLLSVNLLQANISQLTKFNSSREEALQWYASQAAVSKADLTVLPEIAIPYFKEELPGGYWEKLAEKYESRQQMAIIGMPTLDKQKGYGNSAIGLGFDQNKQYDKNHLVPFGEFTPESLKWFTRLMVNDLGDFNRGSLTQDPFVWKDHAISVTICYEDLFGEELAARFVKNEKTPSLFVNISNIAWFGDSMVVKQHLDIARMRSIEFNRPTVRATNSGGTAVISAEGVIVKQLPAFTRGNLEAELNLNNDGITPFAYWTGHWGLMPLWIVCLSILGLGANSKFQTLKRSHRL